MAENKRKTERNSDCHKRRDELAAYQNLCRQRVGQFIAVNFMLYL